jgi:hypothetical protein
MKVGIIRCQQTEDMCPGTTDFKVALSGKLAFEEDWTSSSSRVRKLWWLSG